MENIHQTWHLSGSYYEVCTCEAICPCRMHGNRKGGDSTYDTCDFALSWHIQEGQAGPKCLSGMNVVLAGSYRDDEPGSAWRVILYVDERTNPDQRDALSDIFLGRAGGTTLRNFARGIGEVYAIRTAKITLDHTPKQQRMDVAGWLTAITARPVVTDQPVSCGIPGHDRPGTEIVTATFKVSDDPLIWEVKGRCGFATDFEYSSNEKPTATRVRSNAG